MDTESIFFGFVLGVLATGILGFAYVFIVESCVAEWERKYKGKKDDEL